MIQDQGTMLRRLLTKAPGPLSSGVWSQGAAFRTSVRDSYNFELVEWHPKPPLSTLTLQNLLFCRVPIKFILGFIIRTYKKAGFGRSRYMPDLKRSNPNR